jgi:hypothetical protein
MMISRIILVVIVQINQYNAIASYEGESNETIKSVIKNRNTARLSCRLATVILMVLRVVDRWQYDEGTQHEGAAIV